VVRVGASRSPSIISVTTGIVAIDRDDDESDYLPQLESIADLKRAILKYPTDVEYATRLANVFELSSLTWSAEMLDFCTEFDETSAEEFVAAFGGFKFPLHPMHYTILSHLTYQFPRSSIPQAFAHLPLHRYLFFSQHILWYPSSSSLVDLLLDRKNTFLKYVVPNRIWGEVFRWYMDHLCSIAFNLGRRIRKTCVGLPDIGWDTSIRTGWALLLEDS
jgi:hypothetical protein